MHLSPYEIIFWRYGIFKLNATIVYTWGLMFILVFGSIIITSRLSKSLKRSRWQNLCCFEYWSIRTIDTCTGRIFSLGGDGHGSMFSKLWVVGDNSGTE
jgi:hypothetical protein